MLSHAIPSTDRAGAQSPNAEMRPANARPRAVLAQVHGPVLARGRLTGIYQR